jgi:hypothetical protein
VAAPPASGDATRPSLPPAPARPRGTSISRASELAGGAAAAPSLLARDEAHERELRRRRRQVRRRSPARGRALILALLVAAAVAVIAVLVLSGSSGKKGVTSSGAGTPAAAASGTSSSRKHASKAGGTNPAATSIAVLNGTETTGLAHRIAAQLHASGFSRATAVSGRPPGANQVTVVEYAAGHKHDAEAVAHNLVLSQAQPAESTASSLAGSVSVVVIVGADKATGP